MKTTLAGLPRATVLGPRLRLTTEPAETMEPAPMDTPSNRVTRVASQALRPMTMGPAVYG